LAERLFSSSKPMASPAEPQPAIWETWELEIYTYYKVPVLFPPQKRGREVIGRPAAGVVVQSKHHAFRGATSLVSGGCLFWFGRLAVSDGSGPSLALVPALKSPPGVEPSTALSALRGFHVIFSPHYFFFFSICGRAKVARLWLSSVAAGGQCRIESVLCQISRNGPKGCPVWVGHRRCGAPRKCRFVAGELNADTRIRLQDAAPPPPVLWCRDSRRNRLFFFPFFFATPTKSEPARWLLMNAVLRTNLAFGPSAVIALLVVRLRLQADFEKRSAIRKPFNNSTLIPPTQERKSEGGGHYAVGFPGSLLYSPRSVAAWRAIGVRSTEEGGEGVLTGVVRQSHGWAVVREG